MNNHFHRYHFTQFMQKSLLLAYSLCDNQMLFYFYKYSSPLSAQIVKQVPVIVNYLVLRHAELFYVTAMTKTYYARRFTHVCLFLFSIQSHLNIICLSVYMAIIMQVGLILITGSRKMT